MSCLVYTKLSGWACRYLALDYNSTRTCVPSWTIRRDRRPYSRCSNDVWLYESILQNWVTRNWTTSRWLVPWNASSALVKKLQKFNKVLLRLGRNSCTLRHGRAYFESLLDFYPTFCRCLHPNTLVIHSASFESDFAKIQEDREVNQNTTEKKTLRVLQIEWLSEDFEDVESHSFIERAHKW